MSNIDELEKIQKLKEKGILTETEFEQEKKKILDNNAKENTNINSKISNIKERVNKGKKIKKCKKCGNEIQEGENFCGKCGNKVKWHNTKKARLLLIMIISILIILIGVFIAYTSFNDSGNTVIKNIFSKKVITEDELIQMIKGTQYGIYYEDNSVKIGPIIDYDYEGYNKLISYSCIFKNSNNGVTLDAGALMLYNTENKSYKNIELDGDFTAIIYYLNTSNMDENLESVVILLGQYFEENGIENFGINNNMDKYLNLGKEVGKIVGVKLCRNISNNYITNMTNIPAETKFLYKEGEIYPRYVGTTTTEQKYMWDFTLPEAAYEAMTKEIDSSDRNYLSIMTQKYGPAYKMVTEFSVYGFTNEDVTLQGNYNSLEEAKEKLGVEE